MGIVNLLGLAGPTDHQWESRRDGNDGLALEGGAARGQREGRRKRERRRRGGGG